MEPTGTIFDTIRAAIRSPAPSSEMIKRAEEFKKRKDAENRTSAVSVFLVNAPALAWCVFRVFRDLALLSAGLVGRLLNFYRNIHNIFYFRIDIGVFVGCFYAYKQAEFHVIVPSIFSGSIFPPATHWENGNCMHIY